MSDSYTIAITSQTGTTTHEIREIATIGRSDCDLLVNEPGVSRAHASIDPTAEGCVITDLQSSNGTFVNDVKISSPTRVSSSDAIRLGANVSVSIGGVLDPTLRSSHPEHAATVPQLVGSQPDDADQVTSLVRDNIDVRFIERSAGRKAAKSMLDSARRARKKLAGFGNEGADTNVTIHLVDPFVHNGTLLSSGTIVDTATAQMWCVASAESAVEDPTRAMALIFGAGFPGATEFEPLIAGYGLYRSGQHSAPAADWSELEEPARTQTAAAFIHHLVEQTNDDTVRELLGSAPELLGSTSRNLFGRPMEHLVRSWIAADASDYKSRQFLRLAFKHLWPYKLRQIEVFIYMLLSLAFTSVYPFVTRHLFDNVIPSQDFGQVWRLLLVLIVAFAVSLLAGVRRAYQSTFIAGSVVRDLRQEMFDRAQRLSSSSMRDYQQGEILSRMFQDVGQLQGGLSAMINTGIFQVVSLVVSGVIMLSVNLWLGLLVCVGAPIIAVVYRQMGEGAQKRSVIVQQKRGRAHERCVGELPGRPGREAVPLGRS